MRKQIAIFIACLVLPLGTVRADDTDLCKKGTFGETIKENEDCNSTDGCQWIPPTSGSVNGRCEKCADGTWGKLGSCYACDKDWPHSHLIDADGKIYLSEAPTGATKKEHCYQECEEHGVRIPGKDHAFKVKTSDIEHYDHTCAYTLGCDSDITKNSSNIAITNLCNSYFAYPNNSLTSSCRPRWVVDGPAPANASKCDDGATGKIYIYDAITKKFKCYATACDSDYALIKDNDVFCQLNGASTETALGQCKAKTISCATNLTTSCQKHFQSSNTAVVTGDATWDSNKNDYDYRDCKCSDTSKLTDENGQEIGKATLECNYSAGQWQNCISTGLHSCIAGYCDSDNTQTCKKAPAGTYSGAGDKNCTKCPAGMTSEFGSTDASKCGIRRGDDGTKFCDRVGCFTLPGNGFIYGYTN